MKRLMQKLPRNIIKKMPLSIQYWIGGRSMISDDISAARAIAMRRENGRCQITGSQVGLIGHHLFGVSAFPELAASPWNFFILTSKLHDEFHKWNGGTQKPCTIFHFWVWRYFVLQWWKGYGFSLLSLVVITIGARAIV